MGDSDAPQRHSLLTDILQRVRQAKQAATDPFAPVVVVTQLGPRRLRLELARRAALANVRFVSPANLPGLTADTTVLVAGPSTPELDAAIESVGCPHAHIPVPDTISVEGVRIVSCPDPTVEARVVADALRRAHLAGTPWSAMAVASAMRGGDRPLLDALTRAQIPFRTRRSGPLSQSVAGRFVLGVCDAAASGWSRATVSALWASAPLVHPDTGAPIPWVRWDRASRYDGAVVTGDEWDRAKDDELTAFVDALRRTVGTPPAEVVHGLPQALNRFLPPAGSATWTATLGERADAEGEALDEVRRVLAAVDPTTNDDVRALRGTLEDELADRSMQGTGRVGEGVQVDRPEQLALGDFAFVAVTGLCEAAIARNPSARERRIAALALLTRGAPHQRLVTVPRADPRAEREVHAAPLLLDALARVAGGPVTSEQLHDDPERTDLPVERVPSFTAALLGTTEPAALAALDRDDVALRALHLHTQAGGELTSHPQVATVGGLARTLAADAARRGDAWTPFDGLLGTAYDPTGRAWSVSSLESFHACPLRTFVKDVLGARPLEDPENSTAPTPQKTGTVVHAVLEHLARRWLAERAADPSAPHWSAWLSALDDGGVDAAWDTALAELRQKGALRTGPWWDAHIRWLRGRMRGFLTAEARDDAGFEPLTVEAGATRDEPWLLGTPVGPLGLTGRADRIDADETGTRLRVVDYKTGKLEKMKKAARSDDVLDGGRMLQLPLYAAMHAAVTGQTYEVVVGAYVNPLRASPSERVVTIPLTDVLDQAEDTVRAAAERMTSGDFRYRTGKDSTLEFCRFCDVAACCPVDRGRTELRRTAEADGAEVPT